MNEIWAPKFWTFEHWKEELKEQLLESEFYKNYAEVKNKFFEINHTICVENKWYFICVLESNYVVILGLLCFALWGGYLAIISQYNKSKQSKLQIKMSEY